jgi:hypothetical protein
MRKNIRRIFHEICKPCEHFTSVSENEGVCNECGCNLADDRRTLNKLTFATEACPIGKFRATAKKGRCGTCSKK